MPRRTKSEQTIIAALKDITHSDAETYYVIWKYAPELFNVEYKTFDDLKAAYKNIGDRTEASFEKAELKEDVQTAIKYLLKRLDGKRDIRLLNKYYEKAMDGDVQALKAYMEFKKNFFADDEINELKTILDGANVTVHDDDIDNFKMDF